MQPLHQLNLEQFSLRARRPRPRFAPAWRLLSARLASLPATWRASSSPLPGTPSITPLLPTAGAAAQADPVDAQQAASEERCEVVDPSDPARATRRELSKTIDMLLWGLAILLLCTCCPLGLLFSVVLSLVSRRRRRPVHAALG